jgi:hypothetical protein
MDNIKPTIDPLKLRDLEYKIIANKKRTYQMFLGHISDKIIEDEQILRNKLDLKI